MKPDLNNIQLPDWVRFLAQDADGSWWGYSVEPLMNHHGWYENEVGDTYKLQKTEPNPDWQNSLVKLK